MAKILAELNKKIPASAKISEINFEGSEIVLYTKSKEFFRESEQLVKNIVREIKKRVEVRPDASITTDPEKAKVFIEKTVPHEAGIQAIYFEPELGKVVIESQKPGLVIGKSGDTFRTIKNKIYWLPKIERAPAIKSDVVRAVRNLLHSEIDYRKKFLNKIGQKINVDYDPTEEERQAEWVRLGFLGGGQEVGRSCLLLQTNHSNIMFDCGIEVGHDQIPYLDAPELDLEKLDAVILSHAHTDHSAYIPYLYEHGYKGPLYCTPPTRDVMVMMCLDYVDIAQKEHNTSPYPKKAIEKAIKHSIVLDYGEVSDIAPGVRLTFQPSGHLLGASTCHVHIGNGLHNVLYSADLHYGPTRLLNPAYTGFSRVETLIIESTYKSEKRQSRREAEQQFFDTIKKGLAQGGKILIPSFAVGRAQEVMILLSTMKLDCPVYLDGMLWDATAIHTAYPEYLSSRLQRDILRFGKNIFTEDLFHRVVPKERKKILDEARPSIIIATSGMLSGGPAVEYLKAMASEKRNTLLFVGYQGEGTLGRRIQEGWKDITVTENGRTRTIPLKLQVESIQGLGGHSGRDQLMSFIHNLGTKPERIIVNHGSPANCIGFARDLHRSLQIETAAPKNLEIIRLH